MKVLVVADEENPFFWDYYKPGVLSPYELILSSGDLKAEYLSFLVTMGEGRLLYVHGNHDDHYAIKPPEGCHCIDGKLVVHHGLRILGLGGCFRYNEGVNQYTQKEMAKRIRGLRRAIQLMGGVDIVLTHAAPKGVGDWDDWPHRGFEAFLKLIDQYHPRYMLHGHVHLNYGHNIKREREYGGTKVINCCGQYELEIEQSKTLPELTLMKRLYAKLFVKNLEFIKS